MPAKRRASQRLSEELAQVRACAAAMQPRAQVEAETRVLEQSVAYERQRLAGLQQSASDTGVIGQVGGLGVGVFVDACRLPQWHATPPLCEPSFRPISSASKHASDNHPSIHLLAVCRTHDGDMAAMTSFDATRTSAHNDSPSSIKTTPPTIDVNTGLAAHVTHRCCTAARVAPWPPPATT